MRLRRLHPSVAVVEFVAAIESMATRVWPSRKCDCCPQCSVSTGSRSAFKRALRLVVGEHEATTLAAAYPDRSATAHAGKRHGSERRFGTFALGSRLWGRDDVFEFEWGASIHCRRRAGSCSCASSGATSAWSPARCSGAARRLTIDPSLGGRNRTTCPSPVARPTLPITARDRRPWRASLSEQLARYPRVCACDLSGVSTRRPIRQPAGWTCRGAFAQGPRSPCMSHPNLAMPAGWSGGIARRISKLTDPRAGMAWTVSQSSA